MIKLDPATEDFLKKNPILVILAGVLSFKLLSTGVAKPEWLKDCAPVNYRSNGPWRGKGSFGHGFGSQVRHK